MSVRIVWFKRDLRVDDHAPLATMAARGRAGRRETEIRTGGEDLPLFGGAAGRRRTRRSGAP